MSEEIEVVSWGSRIMDSIKGVLFGLALFLGSFVLLFWNEGRAVQTARGLEEGRAGVVAITPDKVDPAYENKLVYLTAPAVTTVTLTDAQFGIVAPKALRLARRVEMFQWQEESQTKTDKQVGGSEKKTTTYTYKTVWSEQPIDSSKFKTPQVPANPARMEFSSTSFDAKPVTVGAFTLPQDMLKNLSPAAAMPITEQALATLPEILKDRARLDDGQLYVGADPAKPQVGDLRIKFTTLESGPVSLVARQVGKSFQPYLTKAGTELSMIDPGTVSADLMFKHALDSNKMLTWILRAVGVAAMAIGLGLIFAPLATIADVLPFLGSLLGMGIGVFAILVSLVLSLITIAIAWLAYRPILGVGLTVVAVGLVVAVKMMRRKKPAAPPVAPPQA